MVYKSRAGKLLSSEELFDKLKFLMSSVVSHQEEVPQYRASTLKPESEWQGLFETQKAKLFKKVDDFQKKTCCAD